MRAAIFLLAFVVLASATDLFSINSFIAFQQRYGKTYASQEETQKRFAIFKDNMNKASDLQKLNPKATFGVNKFSDLSAEEFAATHLLPKGSFKNKVMPPAKDFSIETPKNLRGCQPNPTTYDWSADCGVCTAVYNQGQCGSCWAFSATETIESYWALAGNTLTQLAMEQIVDCDTTDEACNGGFPENAYQYVESAGGIEPLADYPYTAEGGESGSCQANSADFVCTVTGYSSISGETGLYQQTSSASGGPVSVCVAADTWQTYTGGVITTCDTEVDHCVQLTGYSGYGAPGAYWIVRNSWGSDWGENGFIWVEIGQDLCAIGDYATVVTTGSA